MTCWIGSVPIVVPVASSDEMGQAYRSVVDALDTFSGVGPTSARTSCSAVLTLRIDMTYSISLYGRTKSIQWFLEMTRSRVAGFSMQ